MIASFEKRVTIKYLEELKKELEECGEHLLSETGLWYLEQAGKIGEAIEIVGKTELEPLCIIYNAE